MVQYKSARCKCNYKVNKPIWSGMQGRVQWRRVWMGVRVAKAAARVVINLEWCKGCHICVEVCPRDVLGIDEASFVRGFHPVSILRQENCTGCRQCELLCPDLAISVIEGAQ